MQLPVQACKANFESRPAARAVSGRYDGRMKRRTFFRRVLGSLGAAITGSQSSARPRRVVLANCRLAGFQFHAGESVWPSLSVGADLRLIREPANEHDPRAVAVHFGEHKIGYVPRGDNSSIAELLDRGEALQAHVTKLAGGEDPWERVQLRISLV